MIQYKNNFWIITMNDWTWWSQNVMAQLNSSSHAKWEREENDFYATDPKAVRFLMNFWIPFSDIILEPCCWLWHISKTLEEFWKKVYSFDKIDRGFWKQKDFFSFENKEYDCDIITNPPYSIANEFLLKSLEMIQGGRYIAFFLRIQFLEWVKRHDIYKKFPPKYIYVSSRTIRCAKNGDFENATWNASTYCWFIWEKWFIWDPTIRWFNFKNLLT